MKIQATSMLVLAFLALGLLASLADAVPITIEDKITHEQFNRNGFLGGNLGFGPRARLNYTHPIGGSASQDLAYYRIIEATLTITTKDDRDRAYEYGFVYPEGQRSAARGLSIGGSHTFNVPIDLITRDGRLDITVVACIGDFYVTESVLKLTYDIPDRDVPAAVPEPGTLLLLGSGLLSMATFLKKRF